jgi:hypothetical protein
MKWNFRQGGKTENPKDAGIKEFAKHIFESVVREATQNPVDKRLDKNKPVIVKFDFGVLNKRQIPGFDELVERWKACYEKWKDQAQYEIFLKAILDRIDSFGENVPYLSISDFNTEGMDFTSNEDIDKTGYGAFSRGNHSFHNSDNAAGSEGQGKAALYAISAMRTIFVHTVSNKGSIYEGLTRFATHEYSGEKYNADGYFPFQPQKPEYENESQPDLPFRRNDKELGTTITLIGLWAYEDVEQKMIKAAINNFWMAIHEGDLIIRVGDTELNKQNIESLIEQYLPERNESSHTKSNPTKYGRAKCYYETWTEKFKDLTEEYSKSIDVLGNCTLKISQHPDYPGKIAFLREQKMLIVRSSVNSFVSKGYCGVFICKDNEGNKMLRKMEGKTHTEWDPNLCMTEDDIQNGKKAMESMNRFINESWQNYRSKHFPDTLELKGLAGLSIGNKPTGEKKPTGTKEKKPTVPNPDPKPKPEFEKLGITKKGLRSVKENDLWKYSLVLKSNEDKRLNIRMFPATDAARVSGDDLLQVIQVSDGWTYKNNSIEGDLVEGNNTIEFYLNDTERVALDFKLKSI